MGHPAPRKLVEHIWTSHLIQVIFLNTCFGNFDGDLKEKAVSCFDLGLVEIKG